MTLQDILAEARTLPADEQTKLAGLLLAGGSAQPQSGGQTPPPPAPPVKQP